MKWFEYTSKRIQYSLTYLHAVHTIARNRFRMHSAEGYPLHTPLYHVFPCVRARLCVKWSSMASSCTGACITKTWCNHEEICDGGWTVLQILIYYDKSKLAAVVKNSKRQLVAKMSWTQPRAWTHHLNYPSGVKGEAPGFTWAGLLPMCDAMGNGIKLE